MKKITAKLAVHGIVFRKQLMLYYLHFYNITFSLSCQGFYTNNHKGVIPISDYRSFRAEIKKELVLRGWKHKDLAKATGYSVNAIDSLMCGARASDKLVAAVADALSIAKPTM